MTMQLSDEYELLPFDFKRLVPKSHSQLSDLINFYNDIILGKKPCKSAVDKSWFTIFSQGMSKCDICFTRFTQSGNMLTHKKRLHNGPDMKDPYLSIKNKCLIGCQYTSQNKSDIRKHMILFHGKDELDAWGFNRQYLKYLEGYVKWENITKPEVGSKRTYEQIKMQV